MIDPTEQARRHFMDGLAHQQAGRLVEAEGCYAAALALAPGRPSVLTNLGVTRLQLGRLDEALPLLQQACDAEPDNAEAWAGCGVILAQHERSGEALRCFDRALALCPQAGSVWSHRGTLLREMGLHDEAVESFEQAISHGADPVLNGYFLAAVSGRQGPVMPPRGYVEDLFDTYAGDFEQHLLTDLRYGAHERLVGGLDRLSAAPPAGWQAVLDLGCGTGLCGKLLAGRAWRIDGVDISVNMLDQARATGVYTALHHADVAEHLAGSAWRHDLVVAADVFIYVGALESVFAGVARVLEPGGVFAFSVEAAAEGQGVRLLPSLRYAHAPDYLRGLARGHGFTEVDSFEAPIREDQRRPIPGFYLYLRRQ